MNEDNFRQVVLDTIRENCGGLEVTSRESLYGNTEGDFSDQFFYNAAFVVADILVKLNVIEENIYE